MLIPNYPYYMSFFYTSLAIYFTCLSGRDNHDIFYSMTLPIRKRDIVKSRFIPVIILQLAQIITAIPFAMIRSTFRLPGNYVGIEANVAFLGYPFWCWAYSIFFLHEVLSESGQGRKSFYMGDRCHYSLYNYCRSKRPCCSFYEKLYGYKRSGISCV